MTRGMGPAAACGLLLAMAVPAQGQPPGPEALATVRWAGDARDSVHLLGFVADGDGHVVAHVVADDADRVTGADFVVRVAGNEYTAQGVAYDAASGLGLLRIPTAPLPAPYPFARDPAEPGRVVYGATVNDVTGAVVRRGSISRIQPSDSANPATIWHNALAGERRHGAPLFNNCGEAIGVILERAAAPGAALAAPAEWVTGTFGGAGLAPVRADETCLSEADQEAAAQRRAEAAEQERAAADAALEAAQEQAAAAERERAAADAALAAAQERAAAEGTAADAALAAAQERAADAERERDAADETLAAAQERAADAERERDAADETLEATQERVEAAEQAAADAERGREEARQYVVWAVAAGGLVAVLLAGLWLASRRSRATAVQRKRDAEAEAAEAREAVAAREAEERRIGQTPDVLLTGTDPEGGQIALRVPGRAIARTSGAVVGRSPFEGEVVLNHPEVSRRHFRMFVENGSLRVEDLGSTNGTHLDGVALDRDASRSFGAGAQLRVGEIEFTVQLQKSGAGQEAER